MASVRGDGLELCEKALADFLEAKGSFDVVTMDVVNASRAMGKVHKLVLLSEGLLDDAMLARQLRRLRGLVFSTGTRSVWDKILTQSHVKSGTTQQSVSVEVLQILGVKVLRLGEMVLGVRD